MGKPEDADPAKIIRIHPARGVVESTIWLRPARSGRDAQERCFSMAMCSIPASMKMRPRGS